MSLNFTPAFLHQFQDLEHAFEICVELVHLTPELCFDPAKYWIEELKKVPFSSL